MPKYSGLLTLQAVVLLCVLLGLNTGFLLMLYNHYLIGVVAPKQASVVAAEIQHLRDDIQILPPSLRPEWVQRFNALHNLALERLPDGKAIVEYPLSTDWVRTSEAVIREEAGDDVRIGMRQTATLPIYIVEFNAPDGRYRLLVPAYGLATSRIWPIAWIGLSYALIIFLVILFVTAQIKRPLRKTAAALAQSSDHLTEMEMPASAPAEFRIIAERFNDLVARLRAQERERSMLLAGVSHDLRAPLTRIRVNAEIIDDLIPGKGGLILRDSDSMGRIIDQFLDLQRGVNPKLMATTDFRRLLETVVQAHQDVGCDVRLADGPSATRMTDPSAIERMLNNLIDNAATHGAEPIELELSIDSASVTIQVRDHGPGIQASAIPRLLQPFERLDEARSKFGHCGLGLAIVDRLVMQLRGKLEIRNHPAGGLQVRIRLPHEESAISTINYE